MYNAARRPSSPVLAPGAIGTQAGYTIGGLVVEGVERAGCALTRERFIDAKESLADRAAGGVTPDVSVSATNHHAQRAEMRGGRLVAVTDWIVS